jgi:phosphate/sulfate permease
MPISGTHTVVGALLGAGIVGTSWSQLAADKLIMIVASWFYSPVVAIILAGLFMLIFMHFTMDSHKYSYGFRIMALQAVTGAYLTSIAAIVLIILQKKNPDFDGGHAYVLPATFILGIFFCRLIMLLILKHTSKNKVENSKYLVAFLFPWTTHTVKLLTAGLVVDERKSLLDNHIKPDHPNLPSNERCQISLKSNLSFDNPSF